MLSLFSCARNYSYIYLLWHSNSHVRVFRFVEIRTTGKAKQQWKNRLSNQAEKQKQTQTASCISVTVKGKLAQVSEQRQHPIAEKCRRSRISWRKYRRDKKYISFMVRFAVSFTGQANKKVFPIGKSNSRLVRSRSALPELVRLQCFMRGYCARMYQLSRRTCFDGRCAADNETKAETSTE